MIREIEALSQDGYSPSPGVVYPALTFMQEAGLVQIASEEGGRRSYVASDEGHAQIAGKAAEIERARARLAALADQRERTDAAPIRRAMQNLKTAIFDRLSNENVDRAAILQVAGFIDEAAHRIEGADA
jgi:DNA-binding PadR family transcriptional regulator